jgi:hypothetical protein
MRKDHEFTDIGKHLKARLKQKKRTGMSVAAYMLYHLKQYAYYPDEMTVKFSNGILKVRLVEQEDKTKWFHMREKYRAELNTKLEAMDYQVQVLTIKIL